MTHTYMRPASRPLLRQPTLCFPLELPSSPGADLILNNSFFIATLSICLNATNHCWPGPHAKKLEDVVWGETRSTLNIVMLGVQTVRSNPMLMCAHSCMMMVDDASNDSNQSSCSEGFPQNSGGFRQAQTGGYARQTPPIHFVFA